MHRRYSARTRMDSKQTLKEKMLSRDTDSRHHSGATLEVADSVRLLVRMRGHHLRRKLPESARMNGLKVKLPAGLC